MIFGTQLLRTPLEILMKFEDDNLKTFEVIYKRDFKITIGAPNVNCRILAQLCLHKISYIFLS